MFKKIIPAVIFGVVYAALILFGWGLDDVGNNGCGITYFNDEISGFSTKS